MKRFISKTSSWIVQVDFHNEEQNLASFYVQVMALMIIIGTVLIGMLYVILGENRYGILIVMDVITYSLVIILIRRKSLQGGSNLFLGANLVIQTYAVASVGGIHASGAILYPVLLIFSSLLLDRKRFILYVILCLTSIGFVIYAEKYGWTPLYVPDPPELPLFISYSLIIVLAALFVRFVTENLQNTLRRSQQRENELAMQSEILNCVGQAVVACASDHSIIFWNAAASHYFGWSASEVLGKKCQDVIPISYIQGFRDEICRMLRDGETWSGEIEATQRDGNSLSILATISPLHNRDGARFGLIGIGADIRELKDARDKVVSLNAELENRVKARTAELETAVQDLESFSYTIGHDLRAPLRGMSGFSKIIMEEYAEILPEDVKNKLMRVEGAARTMGELVDALLTFSRLTRITLRCSQVNLSGLVKDAIDTHCSPARKASLTCQIAEDVYAHADPGMMQIAIDHLIDNACKFTSRTSNALIEFGVKQEPGGTVYYIRDNGAGFNMAYSQKLFQPFHRLHHPEEFPGHGIGLVIAQRIIHRHAGSIWAESQPGLGATFYFTLA